MGFDWSRFFTEKVITIDSITVCANRNSTIEFRLYYLPFVSVNGKPAFVYFSWESALLDYLTCKLNLVVHSRGLTWHALNELEMGASLQNMEMRDDINWLRSVNYLPKDLNHRFTILTAVQFREERRLMPFMLCFDLEVWICIAISCILILIPWSYYFNNSGIEKSFIDILAPLLAQTSNKVKQLKTVLEQLRSKFSYIGFTQLILVWLLMTLLISKSFSSLIMNSLFRTKVYPIVETVEDVVNDDQILVNTNSHIDAFKWFNESHTQIYSKLINKINEGKAYFELTELKNNEEIRVKGISEGIYIDFDFEGATQNTRHRCSGRFPNLYLSEHKYNYKPLALIVGRKHVYSRQILALFRISFENGLYIHQKLQTDIIFLGTFDTARENRKFALEIGDKTIRLKDIIVGPLLILPILLPLSILIFILELFISLICKPQKKHKMFDHRRRKTWTIFNYMAFSQSKRL